jgi:hypothetical protein
MSIGILQVRYDADETAERSMAGKTSRKSVKVKKKRATRRVAAKPAAAQSAASLIDRKIKELRDWRGTTLSRVRAIIKAADPGMIEEWKWETPVWSHDGLVCTGETYKTVVKMTFARGASLDDPAGLFNSSLEGKVRRAIDIREGDEIDEAALVDLILAAVALNVQSRTRE